MRRAQRSPALAGAALLAAAMALAADAAADAADPAAFPVAVVGAVEGGVERVTETVLVGRAGQLYHPDGQGTWRRRDSGGIATDVVGAVRDPSGAVYAVADRPPLYRHRDRAWHAFPLPNRGRCVVAVGGALPTITIHRHIYLLGPSGWSRLGSAPERVVALWADAPARVVLALETGQLGRMQQGGAVHEIAHPLGEDDRIFALAGVPGKDPYALADSGAVLRVGGKSASVISRAPELAHFVPHAAGAAGDGTVWVAGALEPPDGPRVAALARIERGRLALAESLEALGPDDRIAVVRAHAGALLVATAAGDVRLREQGGAWQRGRVSGKLPEGQPRSFPRAGPARSR